MALRKSISQDELRDKQKQRGEDTSRHATVYQPSRGGHYPQQRDTRDKR